MSNDHDGADVGDDGVDGGADDGELIVPEADRALLAALGQAIADPVPPGLVDRAIGLITWADVEGELAALLDDADRELTGTRGGAPASTALEFITPEGVVVELTVDDGTLEGQVLGAEVLTAVLEHADGDAEEIEVDELGTFAVQSTHTGAARLRIDLRDHGRIHTDWFVL